MELSQILKSEQNVQLSLDTNHDLPVFEGGIVEMSEDAFIVRLHSESPRARSADILSRQMTMNWERNGVEHECPVFVEKIIGDMIYLQALFNQRREFQRVSARLPLVYEEIDEKMVDSAYQKMLSEMADVNDLEIEVDSYWRSDDLAARIDEQFHQMTRFMDQVNSKLEYLIALSEGRQTPRPAAHFTELTSISGAGISFFDQKALEVNTYLKLRIQLSRFPLREISCIGRVVRLGLTENGLNIMGVKFERIHDNDRERVFRFISRMERKKLRERKETLTK